MYYSRPCGPFSPLGEVLFQPMWSHILTRWSLITSHMVPYPFRLGFFLVHVVPFPPWMCFYSNPCAAPRSPRWCFIPAQVVPYPNSMEFYSFPYGAASPQNWLLFLSMCSFVPSRCETNPCGAFSRLDGVLCQPMWSIIDEVFFQPIWCLILVVLVYSNPCASFSHLDSVLFQPI